MKANELCQEMGGITHRHFQTLSAKRPPTELMARVENDLAISFGEEDRCLPSPQQRMDAQTQREFIDGLLRNGRRRQDRYGELLLKSKTDIFVHRTTTASGGTKYIVDDLRAGTPTTARGNVLTYEFSSLLKPRAEWKILLQGVTQVQAGQFEKVWEACLQTYPKGFTADQFLAAWRQEETEIAAEDWRQVLRVLNPLAEFYLVRSLFSTLKELHLKRKASSDQIFAKYKRYQDWFMDEYDLSPKLYDLALKMGWIALLDEDFEGTQKSGREFPLPENLRIALIFEDPFMTAALQATQVERK